MTRMVPPHSEYKQVIHFLKTITTIAKGLEKARADVFDDIECFYNRKRLHGYVGNINPVEAADTATVLANKQRWQVIIVQCTLA